MVWGEGSDCGQGSCRCGDSLSPASCSWLVWHAVHDGEVWGHSRSRREEGADLNSRLLWVQVRELPCAAGSVNDGLAAGAPKFVLSMVMCWLKFRVCGGILPWERVWHMRKVGELALGGPVVSWLVKLSGSDAAPGKPGTLSVLLLFGNSIGLLPLLSGYSTAFSAAFWPWRSSGVESG